MILVSKVLWGSATVAMLAGSAVVPDVAEAARELAAVFQRSMSGAEPKAAPPSQILPRCAGACDVWAALARTR